jgi:hypothetical protein
MVCGTDGRTPAGYPLRRARGCGHRQSVRRGVAGELQTQVRRGLLAQAQRGVQLRPLRGLWAPAWCGSPAWAWCPERARYGLQAV